MPSQQSPTHKEYYPGQFTPTDIQLSTGFGSLAAYRRWYECLIAGAMVVAARQQRQDD